MTLAKTSLSTGDAINVTFSSPVQGPANEQYWLTVCSAGAPDADWGNWHYVDRGATSDSKLTAGDPGNYEVRLHDGYPRLQYHVVARQAVTVAGGGGLLGPKQ
jgi:hypothetical protein